MIHILQSCIEEDEEDEDDVGNLQEELPEYQWPVQPDQGLTHPPESSPAQEHDSPSEEPLRVTLRPGSQSCCAVVRVPGFLVDTATGNKVQTPGGPPSAQCFQGHENYQAIRKPTKVTWSRQGCGTLHSALLWLILPGEKITVCLVTTSQLRSLVPWNLPGPIRSVDCLSLAFLELAWPA